MWVSPRQNLCLSFLHSPAANAVAGINKAIIATVKCFMVRLRRSCLDTHYETDQDQDNRRIGSRPNQVRKPPLVWSVEFTKKVHGVTLNDTYATWVPQWATTSRKLSSLWKVRFCGRWTATPKMSNRLGETKGDEA